MKLNEAIGRLADMVDEDGPYRIPQADREVLVIVLRAAKMQLHGVTEEEVALAPEDRRVS